MSKRLDVLQALRRLIETALPGVEVLGLDGQEDAPARIGPLGRAVVRSGDPGDPEIDLSPLIYNYEHRIPIELTAYRTGALTNEQVVDQMAKNIGAEIQADRFLGGLVDYLDAVAPTTEAIAVDGAVPARGADLIVIATYSTTSLLGD